MKDNDITQETEKNAEVLSTPQEEPSILDEIHIEELAIDGICGVY